MVLAGASMRSARQQASIIKIMQRKITRRLSHVKTGGIKPTPVVIAVSRRDNLDWQRKLAAEVK